MRVDLIPLLLQVLRFDQSLEDTILFSNLTFSLARCTDFFFEFLGPQAIYFFILVLEGTNFSKFQETRAYYALRSHLSKAQLSQVYRVLGRDWEPFVALLLQTHFSNIAWLTLITSAEKSSTFSGFPCDVLLSLHTTTLIYLPALSTKRVNAKKSEDLSSKWSQFNLWFSNIWARILNKWVQSTTAWN